MDHPKRTREKKTGSSQLLHAFAEPWYELFLNSRRVKNGNHLDSGNWSTTSRSTKGEKSISLKMVIRALKGGAPKEKGGKGPGRLAGSAHWDSED